MSRRVSTPSVCPKRLAPPKPADTEGKQPAQATSGQRTKTGEDLLAEIAKCRDVLNKKVPRDVDARRKLADQIVAACS